MKTVVFTIVAKNYLSFARVLMKSVREWAPEAIRVVVLVDRADGYFDPAGENFDVIDSSSLEIPQSAWFHFKYTLLELSTAIKPYAIERLMNEYGASTILYLDPDIKVYRSLSGLFSEFGAHSILLTPHLTSPLDESGHPTDLDILRSGAYNLGFIGVKRTADTERFLRWWQKRLYDQCVVDVSKGLFVDQRWIDLVPGLFEGVRIMRDPGYNVAYWNLGARLVRRSGTDYTVNGAPLYFFHFSGFDPDNCHRFSKHQNRFTLGDLGDAADLVLDYRDELLANGHADCRTWPYAFGYFENGFRIPDMGRPAHHEVPEILLQIENPFSADGFHAFVDAWNQPMTGADGKPSAITRFAYRLYKTRADVQAAMPDLLGVDLIRFLRWYLSSGKEEHGLPDVFLAPVWEALRSQTESRQQASHGGMAADPIANARILGALAASGTKPGLGALKLQDLNEIVANGHSGLHLSRLSQAIYDSRPDIQQIWPDPCGADGIGFLLWFLTHGTREYSLVEELVSPLRAQWGTVLQSLESPWQRFWYRCLLIGMKTSSECRASIGRMAEFIRMSAVMHTSALRKRRRPDLHIEQPTAAIRAEQVAPEGSGGVNLVGYLRSEMGVGESVRCAARAARSAGIPVALRTVDSEDGPFELGDHSAGLEDREFPHPVNVFHVNADQAPLIMAGLDRELLTGRRNIGYWAWELSEFPDRWLDSFRFFEEIWTPSSFCQDAIARKSSAPVLRIPHAIQADYRVALDRSSFSIPEDRFVFLSVFDLLSVFERKNPLGTIEAFARAFRSSKQCHLVLKVNHAGRRPREMERIAQACAGLPVTILDHTMSREHVNSLIRCCDALISLHRSEGFGLSIAEAMYLGKPVIVTAYSGNMDFTRPDNSFLVGYDLSQVPAGCEPYDEGMTWAEPRVKDAAALLRFVVESPELRQGRALRGKSCIQEEFSPAAIGRLMRNRLDRIIPRVEPAGFVRPPAALARQAPDLLTTARTAS